jgi:hypothetical protein
MVRRAFSPSADSADQFCDAGALVKLVELGLRFPVLQAQGVRWNADKERHQRQCGGDAGDPVQHTHSLLHGHFIILGQGAGDSVVGSVWKAQASTKCIFLLSATSAVCAFPSSWSGRWWMLADFPLSIWRDSKKRVCPTIVIPPSDSANLDAVVMHTCGDEAAREAVSVLIARLSNGVIIW